MRSVLAVTHEPVTRVRTAGRFGRKRTEERVDVWDWTIDGQSLRRRMGARRGMDVSAALWGSGDQIRDWLLTSLLGEADPRNPRYGMADGRVVLLHCPCEDPNCATVTADLVVGEEQVEWRNVGWQVAYEPYERSERYGDVEPFDVAFAREQYDAVLRDLLAT